VKPCRSLASALLLALLLCAVPPHLSHAAGTIYRVKHDAVGPVRDGSSWATAYTTVQDALANATAGDEVWVAAGSYSPGSTRDAAFDIPSDVGLYGGFNGTETARDQRNWRVSLTLLNGDIGLSGDASDNSFHVVRTINANTGTSIDGFTISGGNANGSYPDNHSGGGLFNQDSLAVVRNIVFSGNLAKEGGAMANLRSNVQVTNVIFAGNAAVIGGAMTNYSNAPQLVNVTFSGNRAQYGGGMYNTSSWPTLINVTFSGNAATGQGGGGAINSWGGRPTLQNCILWGNTDDTNAQLINLNGAVTTVRYSLVAGGYAGTGNLNTDPRFVDADGPDNISGTLDDNLRLRADSPAIDAGNNSPVPTGITTDLDGQARFSDQPFVHNTGAGTVPIVDMGAYEVSSHLIYVDADATGTNDGTSWANAYINLQAALADASRGEGTVILVAEGTYEPGINRADSFRLVDSVALYGGFGGTETTPEQRDLLAHPTILSGNIGSLNTSSDNSYHVVTNDVAHAILDGFVIVNGNANAASYPNNSGGGILVQNGSPFLSNLTFLGNAAANGGGLYNGNGNASVHNAVFSGNTASAGGALFSANGSPTVSNTAFSGNAAPSGGAIFAAGSNAPLVRNSILWDNGTAAVSGTVNIAYSIVQGGAVGAGNKDADPRFVDAGGLDNILGTLDDNLRLRAGSPAIDAGDNAVVPGDVTTDRDGNPRFVEDRDVVDTGRGSPPLVDMGAYEYAPLLPSGPPADLSATPASRSSIALRWSDNSHNESSFMIERSPDGSSGWTGVGRVRANSTVFTDTGRLCQTPYFYRVYASNASGVSAPSNTANATILDCTLEPPTNLMAAPASPSSILLIWSDNSDNEGGFRVERSPDGVGGWTEIGQVPTNQTSFVVDGVTCGPPSFYRVRASNPGAVSSYTNVASTSVCPPDAPTGLAATTSSRMGIALIWTDNSFNESGFAIERSLDGASNWAEIERVAANDMTYGSRGLDCNTTYFYRVRAFHLGGMSLYSNTASATTAACVSQTIYVNAAAIGSNDGQSWASAYTNLQDAMTAAIADDEIWVATGTYNPGSKRSDTFQLTDGAAVYGGFAGTETARDQRDWRTNITILSGYGYNYHVASSDGAGPGAVLDGFTIMYGRADGNVSDRGGAGMHNDHSSPTVRNIIFSNNYALSTGAGMFNIAGSNPTLIDVIFDYNTAWLGGGMENYQSGATLRGVIFRNNSASTTQNSGGGGLLLWDRSSAILTDVTFENNVSGFFGGGIHCENSTVTMTRTSFIGNRASAGGGGLSTLNSTATISDVVFANNVGGEGGGFRNDNSITTIHHAIFQRNAAGSGGGGIAHKYAGALTLYEAVFAGNSADWGGGMYFAEGESSTISNATFVGNSAWWGASGLFPSGQ
jgi:predicted outer membrane repeat protein